MCNVQRAITPKVGKPELRFMCSVLCLMVLYICVKFHENITNGIRVKERTLVHGKNSLFQYLYCSKGCNSKSRLTELWFLCSACHLMMLYICERFHENILISTRVMERTRVHGRNGYVQCSKGNNSISRQIKVTVHVFCTSSHGDLHWCEVSWKYIKTVSELWSGHEIMKRWLTDRRTLKISDGIT